MGNVNLYVFSLIFLRISIVGYLGGEVVIYVWFIEKIEIRDELVYLFVVRGKLVGDDMLLCLIGNVCVICVVVDEMIFNLIDLWDCCVNFVENIDEDG